jgi:hypothetical protein
MGLGKTLYTLYQENRITTKQAWIYFKPKIEKPIKEKKGGKK